MGVKEVQVLMDYITELLNAEGEEGGKVRLAYENYGLSVLLPRGPLLASVNYTMGSP